SSWTLRNANDFSILSLCATRRFSLVAGEDFWPDAWSQHAPVQVVAIELHTANGARIFISTSAVTRASSADASVSIRIMRLTLRKSSQAFVEWICATHKSTASASGAGET